MLRWHVWLSKPFCTTESAFSQQQISPIGFLFWNFRHRLVRYYWYLCGSIYLNISSWAFRCLTIVGYFAFVFQDIQLQKRKTVLVFWIHPCPIPAKALSTWQRCELNQKLSNVWKDLGLVPIRILLQYIGLIHHPEQWQVRLTWILLVNIQDAGILVVTVLGEHPVCVNYNRRTSFCIWFLAAWLANVWSSLQCRVLPFQSIWKVSNLFILTSLICICLACWHMLTVFWDWKRCTKKTQHGNKKKREQMKIVECEKDDQMLAMSWIIRKERPWDVDFGGFA